MLRATHVDVLDTFFFISSDQNRQFQLISLLRSIILTMQATQSLSQQLLPRSAKGTKTISKEGHATRFVSNLYEIKLKNGTAPIFQFSLDITPELPANSNALKDKIVATLHRDLWRLVEKFAHKGDMLWGRKALSKPESMVAEFDRNKDHFRFQVLVKQVKEISVENFIIENPDNLPAICQVFNINTKNMLKKGKMVELSPGNYYHQNGLNQNNTQYGLNVWRGFKATVAPYNGRIFLQVDACSRVLRQESFLVTLEADRKELRLQEMEVKYKGSPVLMRFGNLKVYHIDGLQFKMTPKNTFYYAKEGREISYIEYFKSKYGYVVKNEKQPLVRAVSKKPKHLQPKSPPIPEFIYILPEMLTLTGLSDAQRSNFRIMKSLDPFTKLTPQQRMRETFSFLEALSGQEELMFKIKPEPHMVDGYQLEAPQIKLGPNRKTAVKNGNINLREAVLQPHKFESYYFCYSAGRDPHYDQGDCDYAIDQMKTAAKTFGITICEPYWVEVPNGQSIKDWQKELEFTQQKAKEQKTDIIIFFLKPNEERHYAELKRLTSRSFNCPSQMIKRKSLSNNTKGVLSFASKIVLQMNSKIGHPLWSVPNHHPFWREKGSRVATAGIASSRGKQGTFISFVGTTNADLTHIVSECKEAKSRQALSAALFQALFTTWLQNYYAKNQKQLPTTLVIYREGLNDTQARHQFEVEVQGLIQTINVVRAKAKCPEYNPNIQYLLVNKKPNSRMFQGQAKGKQTQYFNPLPGSVIFEELSKDGCRSFHLTSVDVRFGSCTPVQFKVGYENSNKVSLDALAELTYNQCYCYFNWTGGVRVPACLQDANRLAKQCSEIGIGYINDEKGSDLKFKPFFL